MNHQRRPVVIAYHLIWTAYGWWLPNDPRGSTSNRIACNVIAQLGELHFGRKKVQPAGRVIREFYQRAKDVLKFDLLTFTREEIQTVAQSFRTCLKNHRYTCYACAIMPDHVHVLLRKHKHRAEEMTLNFQEQSRLDLQKSAARPAHPVWGGPGWKVFLDHPDGIRRTIRYIDNNPGKIRLPRQEWDFVKEYDGWPMHRKNR